MPHFRCTVESNSCGSPEALHEADSNVRHSAGVQRLPQPDLQMRVDDGVGDVH